MFTRKKLTAVVGVVAAVMLALTGCSSDPKADKSTGQSTSPSASASSEGAEVNLGLIGGFPSISAANLLESNEKGETQNKYKQIKTSKPDEITTKLVNGELDAATVPTNLAATLYNKKPESIQIAAATTLGVIPSVSRDPSVTSRADLYGHDVISAGEGAIPQYTLLEVLKKKGLKNGEDLNVEFFPGHDEVVSQFASGKADTAAIPVPAVVKLMQENQDVHVVADLSDQWEKIHPGTLYAQGALVLSKKFVDENPLAAKLFVEEYRESAEAAKKNVEETAKLTGKFELMPTQVAKEAIPKCHQVFITGSDLKDMLTPFLEMLHEANPASVGGEVPGADFYFGS